MTTCPLNEYGKKEKLLNHTCRGNIWYKHVKKFMNIRTLVHVLLLL